MGWDVKVGRSERLPVRARTVPGMTGRTTGKLTVGGLRTELPRNLTSTVIPEQLAFEKCMIIHSTPLPAVVTREKGLYATTTQKNYPKHQDHRLRSH